MHGQDDVPDHLHQLIRDLVADLVAGRYDALVDDGRIGRLRIDDLQRVIDDYPATLTPLPEQAFDGGGYAFVIAETDPPEWAVEQALWTVEEGRSDLELRADVRWRNGEYRVELSDVLVP
jgi:ABC-type amino acid transport substrate-binding protein